MTTATKKKSTPDPTVSAARQRVQAEIESMLQINGNTPTAHDWVPRVVMMAYERRCANNPDDDQLAACFSVAQSLAGRS